MERVYSKNRTRTELSNPVTSIAICDLLVLTVLSLSASFVGMARATLG